MVKAAGPVASIYSNRFAPGGSIHHLINDQAHSGKMAEVRRHSFQQNETEIEDNRCN